MNKLVNICNKINIEISDDQINCFEKYYELLIESYQIAHSHSYPTYILRISYVYPTYMLRI